MSVNHWSRKQRILSKIIPKTTIESIRFKLSKTKDQETILTTKCTINATVDTHTSKNKNKVGKMLPGHKRQQRFGG